MSKFFGKKLSVFGSGLIATLALAVVVLATAPNASAGLILISTGTVGPDTGGGVFNVSGTLVDATSFSGTITVDTTSGLATASTLTYLGDVYGVANFTTSFFNFAYVSYGDASKPGYYFNIVFDQPSLVNYNGGGLCGTNYSCFDSNSGYYVVGNWQYPDAPTPEPGTLALFGSGVVGLAGYARRKFGR